MNTPELYNRQRPAPATPPRAARPDQPTPPREFATFGDPSLRETATTSTDPAAPQLRTATRWVRPTELTDVGMRVVGRAIDRGFDAQARVMFAVVRGASGTARRLGPRHVPPSASNEPEGMAL